MRRAVIACMLLIVMTPALHSCGGGGQDTASPPVPRPLDTWHLRNPFPQGEQLISVTRGNGLFVAVGDKGIIMTSPDGASWRSQPAVTTDGLKGVVYGNGLYAAVGDKGIFLTSPDAESWTEGAISLPFSPDLTEIAFGNGKFAASGVFGPNIFSYTSPDGVTWTAGPGGIHAITYADGAFLAVQTYVSVHGYYGWSQTAVKSVDGILWTPVSTLQWPYDIRQIAHGKGLYVGVGGTSTSAAVVTSADGVTWTERSAGTAEPLSGVAYGGGFFVAVGNNGTLLISSDGINWTSRRQDMAGHLSGVTYGNGAFVAVGWNGIILQSDPLQEPAP